MILSERALWEIWSKGKIVPGNDPLMWRQDSYGAWICRRDYKNTTSEYGWEVGRMNAGLSQSDIWNLCPLNCKNSNGKDDLHPECHVTAQGVHNCVMQ